MQKAPKSTLMSSNIEDIPSAILGIDGAHTMELWMQSTIRSTVLNNGVIPDSLLQRLSVRPNMVADLFADGLVPDHQRTLLLELSPPTSLRAMLCDYVKFAPEMEAIVANNQENLERLVQFFRLPGSPRPLHDMAVYTDPLKRDPNRLLRVLDTDPAVSEQDFRDATLGLAHDASARRRESPAWAFFHLRVNGASAIAPDLIDTIRHSDEYSFLAAKLCRALTVPTTDWSDLVHSVKDPRWIYHLLKEGIAFDPREALVKLLPYPAWLTQYLSTASISAEEVSRLFLQCQELAEKTKSAAPYLAEMNNWFRSRTRGNIADRLASLVSG